MKTRLYLAALAMLSLLFSVSACGPGGADDPVAGVQLKERDPDDCAPPDRKINVDGYCVCVDSNQLLNTDTNECIACTPDCSEKECGSDGCWEDVRRWLRRRDDLRKSRVRGVPALLRRSQLRR